MDNFDSEYKLPYEESEAGFNEWFRQQPVWQHWLDNDEADNNNDRQRYEVLLDFFWKQATKEEVERYFTTLRRKGLGRLALNMEERLMEKRPELKLYD